MKSVAIDRNLGMAQSEALDHVVDLLALLVTRIGVDDGEAVHVKTAHPFRYRNQAVRVYAPAHAKGERHVGAQAQLDGARKRAP